MAVETLKSTAITNLDSNPIVPNTSGEGAPATVQMLTPYVTISAAASATSKYLLARLATTVKMKSIAAEWEAMGAGKVNLSLYYSDSTTDGTPQALVGTLVSGGDQLFASDLDLASASAGTQVINESGNFPLSKRDTALWSAVGLSADPGGFFDIVAVVHTTDITTGAARFGLRVEYAA